MQYEANVTNLRIDFDEGWDGFAKTVTFWNALMANPVKRVLTTDVLEDIYVSPRVYVIPIPGEAMDESGDMTFVIDGYADGQRKRSLSDTLWVKEAPIELDAGEPTDPTPSQAEQMQGQLDQIIQTIADSMTAARDSQSWAEYSQGQAEAARDSAVWAQTWANESLEAREGAETAQGAAESAKKAAQIAQVAAEIAQSDATARANAAENAKNEAQTALSTTLDLANAASTASNLAKASETAAAASAAAAKGSETNADAYRTSAYENAVIAKNARDAASGSATAAASSAAAAAKSAEEAKQAAGGDFVTHGQAQEYVSEHNTSTTAHADMRTELAAVARAKTGGEIDQRLQNRIEKTGDKMTGILEFDTPGLFSAIQKKRLIGDTTYLVRLGIGSYGTGGNISLRLVTVDESGNETGAGQFDIDADGLTWVTPGGLRKTVAHSGNIGLLTATVE